MGSHVRQYNIETFFSSFIRNAAREQHKKYAHTRARNFVKKITDLGQFFSLYECTIKNVY